MTMKAKTKDTLLILKDMFLDFLRKEHRYIVGFIFIIILGFLFELAGWWFLMLLAGGVGGFLMKKPGHKSFLIGFLSIALVWFGFFIVLMIIGPIFELMALVMSILGVLEGLPSALMLITIIIGGLLGGLGAWNGTYIASLIYSGKEETSEPIKKK
ncbi:MAG: hypothetical protein ACTSQI_09585 [Candidatus Helarchaeota archaeon]